MAKNGEQMEEAKIDLTSVFVSLKSLEEGQKHHALSLQSLDIYQRRQDNKINDYFEKINTYLESYEVISEEVKNFRWFSNKMNWLNSKLPWWVLSAFLLWLLSVIVSLDVLERICKFFRIGT